MITVACVRTGTAYPVDYVHRLRRMVARHLDRPHRFVVLTDDPTALPGYEAVHVSRELPKWWAKMALFSTGWREGQRALYFDLDTVIAADLAPLADWHGEFGVCENFARLGGSTSWPCRYGSCVMSFGAEWGIDVWQRFLADRSRLMIAAGRYGDQWVIERLVPDAALLQRELPAGYFMSYRDLVTERPDGCAVVCFGGSRRPHNCSVAWVREAWR